MRARIATCYVCIDVASDAIAGFYTLNTSAVPYEMLTTDETTRVTPYPALGAYFIGRLASSVDYRKTETRASDRIGEKLLNDALYRCHDLAVSGAGAIGVLVEAIDDEAQRFYEKYDFRVIEEEPYCRLFIAMKKIKKMKERAAESSPTVR